jgi:hypothetical protein
MPESSSPPPPTYKSPPLSRTESPIEMPSLKPTPLAPSESLDTESMHDKKVPYHVNTLAQDAQEATTKEQNMTLREGLRMYPNAIMWSVIISTCIAMEGYDLCLLGNFCKSRPQS